MNFFMAPEGLIDNIAYLLIFLENRFFWHFDFIVFLAQFAHEKSNASIIFFISGRKNWVFDHFESKKRYLSDCATVNGFSKLNFRNFHKIDHQSIRLKEKIDIKKIRKRIDSFFKKILMKFWRQNSFIFNKSTEIIKNKTGLKVFQNFINIFLKNQSIRFLIFLY